MYTPNLFSAFLLLCNFQTSAFTTRISPRLSPYVQSNAGSSYLQPLLEHGRRHLTSNLRQSAVTVNPFDEENNSPFSVVTAAYHNYMKLCKTRPLATKSITAGFVMAFGDIIAQVIDSFLVGSAFKLNSVRLGTFILVGLFFKGPYLHYWYSFLARTAQKMEREHGVSQKGQVFGQMLVDQTLGSTAFYFLYFFVFEVFQSLMMWRAPSLARATAKCSKTFLPVMIANLYIWPLASFVNFRYIPESMRVLKTSLVAVFWNVFLCTKMAR